mgnify:CR=1 FL=1
MKIILLLSFSLMLVSESVIAEELDANASEEKESPWLLTPTISSDPKLGTTLGFMGAYIKKFDKESPASMFGLMGSYSDTDSFFYGAFTRSYFDADKQRITAGLMKGKVNNNYEDFLGSGFPVSTTDDIGIAVFRYFHLYKNHWYLGFQLVSTDYAILADDALSGEIIDLIGLIDLPVTVFTLSLYQPVFIIIVKRRSQPLIGT